MKKHMSYYNQDVVEELVTREMQAEDLEKPVVIDTPKRKTNTGVMFFCAFCVMMLGVYVVCLIGTQRIKSCFGSQSRLDNAAIVSDIGELDNTILTKNINTTVGTRKNVLWSAGMQFAWDELSESTGGELSLANNRSLSEHFNEHIVGANDLNMECIATVSGFDISDSLEDIKTQFKYKYHQKLSSYITHFRKILAAGDLHCFSFLQKAVSFDNPFHRFDESPLQFGSTEVESFGIENLLDDDDVKMKASEQVRIYGFVNANDFVVEIATSNPNEQLFLAKVEPGNTLYETINAVMEKINTNKPLAMDLCVTLQIPVLDFDINDNCPQLTGERLVSNNPAFNNKEFSIVENKLRFRLDESGRVEKRLSVTSAAAAADDLIFDKPFLVMMKKKNSTVPYLAMWIANEELLVEFEPREQ